MVVPQLPCAVVMMRCLQVITSEPFSHDLGGHCARCTLP